VFNAGRTRPSKTTGLMDITKIRDSKIEKVRNLFEVNIISCSDILSSLLKILNTGSRIIYVSFSASLKPTPTFASYCASKAAGNMLIKCLAIEEPEMTFLSIDPGVVDTPMSSQVRSDASKEVMPKDLNEFFVNADLLSPDVP
jgi:NAD(P)-dependent dehydrogenase (short-subunit alcohol dehydrogenase family)